MECHVCHSPMPDESAYCPHCGTPVPGAKECREYTYEAFISYRHLDLDRGVAKKLQRFLEGLKPPKHLEVTNEKKRLGRLFRDEDELPTSSSLSEQIQDALKHSRYLVVVCTPKTPESLWVMREVETFASLHGRDHIIVALAEGEPEESFPPLLLHRYRTTPDGECQLVEEEPIAADFRASEQKKFRDEALRVAAALFGCNYDDLRQRMRARRMQVAAIAAAATAVVSLAFGTFSFYQQVQIQENHRASQIHESELLAAKSEELLARGDRHQAIQVALRALPENSADNSRPRVPAATMALQRALELYPSINQWTSDYSIPLPNDGDYYATDKAYLATVANSEDINIYDMPLGKKHYTLEKAALFPEANSREAPFICMDIRNDWLICCYGNTVLCLEADAGKEIWRAKGSYTARAVCAGDEALTVLYADGLAGQDQKNAELVVYGISDGKVLRTQRLDTSNNHSYALLDCDDSGKRIAYLQDETTLFVCDSEGKAVSAKPRVGHIHNIRFDREHTYVISGEVLPKTVYIEAFDKELNRLWEHEEQLSQRFTGIGRIQQGSLAFCGADADGTFRETIDISAQNDLVVLDPNTGSVLSRMSFSSPILDCRSIGKSRVGVLTDGSAFMLAEAIDERSVVSEKLTPNDFVSAKIAIVPDAGVFIVGKSLSPTKIATFHFGDSFVSTFSGRTADWFEENTHIISDNNRYALVADEGLTTLDNTNLKPIASLLQKDLPALDWPSAHISFADGDVLYLWSQAKDNDQDVALYRAVPNGTRYDIAASTILKQGLKKGYPRTSNDDRLHIGNNGDVVWQANDRVFLLDAEDLAILQEIPAESGDAIDYAGNGADTILICERDDQYMEMAGRYRLIDKSTGKDILSDVQRYSYFVPYAATSDLATMLYRAQTSNDASPAVDLFGQTIALPCSDNRIRAFSLSDGTLLWESSEVPPHLAFLCFTANGDLLVQDEQGYCSLLSGDDGSVVSSTMVTLPPASRCILRSKESITVGYTINGSDGGFGMAVILTDRDSFGPSMDLPLGVAIAEGSNEYLAYDASSKTYKLYALSALAYDTLIEVANVVIEGHELSEAESALYQVDE